MNTVPMKPSSPTDATNPQQTPGGCPPSPNGGGKAKRNFYIDLATTLVFGSMVGTGILLKWVLPPGRFGGRGLTWLGFDRHTWGDVHLWLAFGLLALIVTHVVLHWSWVTSCWRRCLGNGRSARTWAVVSVLAVLLLLPLVVPTSQQAGRGLGRGRGRALHAAADSAELDQARGQRGGWAKGTRGRRFRDVAASGASGPNLAAPNEDDEVLDLGTELWEGDFGP